MRRRSGGARIWRVLLATGSPGHTGPDLTVPTTACSRLPTTCYGERSENSHPQELRTQVPDNHEKELRVTLAPVGAKYSVAPPLHSHKLRWLRFFRLNCLISAVRLRKKLCRKDVWGSASFLTIRGLPEAFVARLGMEQLAHRTHFISRCRTTSQRRYQRQTAAQICPGSSSQP